MNKQAVNDPYSEINDKSLARAIELLVAPEMLMSREVTTAILSSLCYTQEEVIEQLAENIPLHDGQMLSWNF